MTRIAVTEVACGSATTEHRFHYLTDTHVGARDHAGDALRERIEEIRKDPNALWGGGGDYGDFIVPGDKRFVPDILDDEARHFAHRLPDLYLDRMQKLFAPIVDKCLFLGVGNHETVIGERYHRGIVPELASKLGRPELYTGYRGWAVVRFAYHQRHQQLKFFHYHGWSGGRLKGRKELQAERDIGAWNADVICLGHDHQPHSSLWLTEELYPSSSVAGKYLVRHRPRVVINGGAWVGGQTDVHPPMTHEEAPFADTPGWATRKNFRPERVGGPVLNIKVFHGQSSKVDSSKKASSIKFTIETRS
jgi:hypothetical protein